MIRAADCGMAIAGVVSIMDRRLEGIRCRTVRPIMHHAGAIPRESAGVVRYEMENFGRRLMRIDFDSGRSLVLLAEDVALEAGAD